MKREKEYLKRNIKPEDFSFISGKKLDYKGKAKAALEAAKARAGQDKPHSWKRVCVPLAVAAIIVFSVILILTDNPMRRGAVDAFDGYFSYTQQESTQPSEAPEQYYAIESGDITMLEQYYDWEVGSMNTQYEYAGKDVFMFEESEKENNLTGDSEGFEAYCITSDGEIVHYRAETDSGIFGMFESEYYEDLQVSLIAPDMTTAEFEYVVSKISVIGGPNENH